MDCEIYNISFCGLILFFFLSFFCYSVSSSQNCGCQDDSLICLPPHDLSYFVQLWCSLFPVLIVVSMHMKSIRSSSFTVVLLFPSFFFLSPILAGLSILFKQLGHMKTKFSRKGLDCIRFVLCVIFSSSARIFLCALH